CHRGGDNGRPTNQACDRARLRVDCFEHPAAYDEWSWLSTRPGQIEPRSLLRGPGDPGIECPSLSVSWDDSALLRTVRGCERPCPASRASGAKRVRSWS